jgi:hypothetical protein
MAAMKLEAVFAALPNGPLSETEFDDALRRIFKIAEWDGAMLEAYRTTAFHNRLIVEDADGLLVKAAELPRWPTQEERDEALRVQERKEMFAATEGGAGWVSTPRDGSDTTVWTADASGVTNPFRMQLEQLISELLGGRVAALEEQLSDLQEQLAAVTPLEVAA